MSVADFFMAVIGIVVMDLVLAGDNAIVIGMAARNVPKIMQNRVVLLGTCGAVVIRILATLIVVWLLKLPGLLVVGGLLLIWIAYKLMVDKEDHVIKAKDSIWGAVGTIVLADAAMGLDNVLAVAGAAHGHFGLVITGLLISIPIVVWGSTLFIKLLERFNWILYIGAGIIAFTAGKMIADEPILDQWPIADGIGKWAFTAICVILVLSFGIMRNRSKKNIIHQQ
ncbi:TerC family protein [Gorillibacterium massiliense]|uniref:TerC family protein n=1 Tax=Gorillibacterium massiliense TaxID=1280390 RepID=UPI0004AC777C|nr:TerC family protein [Gorillibacterium massiliense]